jgi:hypothetical protein
MKSLKALFAVLLIFAISGLVWSPAHAQKMQCRDRFKSLDGDNSGYITKEEFMKFDHPGAKPEEVFDSRDADADGKLNMEEFCAHKGSGMGQGKGQGKGGMQQ